MLNNFILVGRMEKIEPSAENSLVTLKVSRPYKNDNGVYEDDLIDVIVSSVLNKTLEKYCAVGDVIGIKGRIQQDNVLFAEKITLLSNKK